MSEWELVEGRWLHRPWWKVAINTVLRAVQTKRRPAKLWVIYTKTGGHPAEPPIAIGYGFGKVMHK